MIRQIRLAGCVIQNAEGKVLLLHRDTSKRVQWETPGGKIENRENPIKTAQREVKEELDVSVKIVEELGRQEFTEDGFIMDYVWYKAAITSGEPKIMEEKFNKFGYFSWQELKKMKDELSPNTANLVDAYFTNRLRLKK